MNRILIACLKPFSFLPAICMMLLIFSFSAQPGTTSAGLSEKVSDKIVVIADKVLDQNWTPSQLEYYSNRIHTPVRKAAHMTEYCLLAICISFPLYVYGLRGFPLLFLVGLLCAGFAATDEYHQSFVAGRGPSLKDVGIDTAGALIGILFVRIFCWICLGGNTRKKKPSKKRKRFH